MPFRQQLLQLGLSDQILDHLSAQNLRSRLARVRVCILRVGAYSLGVHELAVWQAENLLACLAKTRVLCEGRCSVVSILDGRGQHRDKVLAAELMWRQIWKVLSRDPRILGQNARALDLQGQGKLILG